MYNKKNLFILLLFAFIFTFVLYISLTSTVGQLNNIQGQGRKSVEHSHFQDVHYFKLLNSKASFELQSTELDIIDNKKLSFLNPIGVIFSKGRRINYEAKKGNLDQDTQILNLEEDVNIADETSDYLSDRFKYDKGRGLIYADGNVFAQMIDKKTLDIIKVRSQKLISNLLKEEVFLDGSVRGQIIRKRRYEPGLKFHSENLMFKSLESLLELNKSVKIYRNNYDLRSERAEIFLGNYNKRLKYYVLYDDVKLEEKLKLPSGRFQTRKAFSEKLEGYQRAEKIILTGAPRVEQGDDVIKGYQITLRESVELIEVDDSRSSFNLKKEEK